MSRLVRADDMRVETGVIPACGSTSRDREAGVTVGGLEVTGVVVGTLAEGEAVAVGPPPFAEAFFAAAGLFREAVEVAHPPASTGTEARRMKARVAGNFRKG
jgi:hypothetical protein